MDATTRSKRRAAPGAALRSPPSPRSTPARGYPDLHDHLRALDAAGLLITVDRPINKDTEMHPLVRWQFRGGIEEKDRKAFLFTNVVDGKGRKYDIPVAVGVLAANREIYRIGMGCRARRDRRSAGSSAARNPIPPRLVDDAPCQEIVIAGKALDKPGQRPRRHSAADLDAGLGRRALCDAVAIHHQGSRHRHPEHGQSTAAR